MKLLNKDGCLLGIPQANQKKLIMFVMSFSKQNWSLSELFHYFRDLEVDQREETGRILSNVGNQEMNCRPNIPATLRELIPLRTMTMTSRT